VHRPQQDGHVVREQQREGKIKKLALLSFYWSHLNGSFAKRIVLIYTVG